MGLPKEQSAKENVDRFAEQLREHEAVLFWEYLDHNSDAKQVFTGLYRAGCDPLTVMTLAVLYCTGERLGVTQITKQATGYTPQQLGAFSERLLQAAKDIQALNQSAMPGGVTLWKLIRVLGGGEILEKALASILPSQQLDFEFTRLPVVLAAYAVFLKGWPHPEYRRLSADRSEGRKYFLARLAVYLEAVVGHANWSSMAALLGAIHFACGQSDEIPTDAETCRHDVENFQTKHPELYAEIQQQTRTAMER